MILFNISDPLTLLLMVLATALLIFLAQEIKKSNVAAITLFAYLGILIMHVIQLSTLSEEFREMLPVLSRCIIIDFLFVGFAAQMPYFKKIMNPTKPHTKTHPADFIPQGV